MVRLFRVVIPARPGPADAHDALVAGLAPVGHWCLFWVVMPGRPKPADAHAALAVGLPPSGHLGLMLMILLLWVVRPRSHAS